MRQAPTVLPFQRAPAGLDTDPLGFAANTIAGQILQNSSSSYLQKGQAYVQSKIGLLSGSAVHYHFNVDSAYIASKLFMIVAPFLKQWSWTRSLEQVCLILPVLCHMYLQYTLAVILKGLEMCRLLEATSTCHRGKTSMPRTCIFHSWLSLRTVFYRVSLRLARGRSHLLP